MIQPDYVRLMAAYGEWQNRNLFAAASTLSDEQRKTDCGLFFGSMHATLSHLLWGDQIWLHRLAGASTQPMPVAPDVAASLIMCPDWAALGRHRQVTDQAVLDWAQHVTPADLLGELSWDATSGEHLTRLRWTLVVQLFNHGTHHRGQVHGALTAAGVITSDTDVQYMESPHWP